MYIPKTDPDLLAEIYYLTTEEGGRKSWVGNGYRGQFYYNGRDWDTPQEFIDKDICNPGEKSKCISTDFKPSISYMKILYRKNIRDKRRCKSSGKRQNY